MTDSEDEAAFLNWDGEAIPFGQTPDPESGALVIKLPGGLPPPPKQNDPRPQDYDTPEGLRLYAGARELARQHPERFPLTRLWSVWITYRTTEPMTWDEFDWMTDIVSNALWQAGVIDNYSIYGDSDFEIDRDLGDAYSLEIHDLGQDSDHG